MNVSDINLISNKKAILNSKSSQGAQKEMWDENKWDHLDLGNKSKT